MKRLLQLMKQNVIGFIVGGIVFGSLVAYATSLGSDDVTYDNTTSGSSATTVKEAIDDLYTKASSGGEIVFKRLTTSTTSVDCGFRPRMIIVARGMNSNYPQLVAIDYEHQKAAAVYHNNSNSNGGMNYDDNGYGFSYIPNWYSLTDTGFNTKTYIGNQNAIDGGSSSGAYVWCIK